MVLGCSFRKEETIGDLPIGVATRYQFRDLAFARGQDTALPLLNSRREIRDPRNKWGHAEARRPRRGRRHQAACCSPIIRSGAAGEGSGELVL